MTAPTCWREFWPLVGPGDTINIHDTGSGLPGTCGKGGGSACGGDHIIDQGNVQAAQITPGGECVMHVAGAGGRTQRALLRGVPGALEQLGDKRPAEPASQACGNALRLVETASLKGCRVQWNGGENVGNRSPGVGDMLGQQITEYAGVGRMVSVFQARNQPGNGVFVGEGSQAMIEIGVALAIRTGADQGVRWQW